MPTSRRRHPLAVTLALALAPAAPAPLAAQGEASPYLPLHHWTTPYVEHLIAAGVMPDPHPMTRPFRRSDVVRALRAVDIAQARPPVRSTVRTLLEALDDAEPGPIGRAELYLGAGAATHSRRDPLRATGASLAIPSSAPGAGRGDLFPTAGAALSARFGPVVVASHPYIENRLKWDPDYFGKRDRVIAGRSREAYVALQTRYADVVVGALDRNWGPPFAHGLLLSPAPFSYAHLGVRLGTPGVRLDAVLTELDPLPDRAGEEARRFFVAHRLTVRPPGPITLSLWEGIVFAGPGRGLDPWFANVATLGLLGQYDEDSRGNFQLGLDLRVRPERWPAFYGSLMIDDIQVDRDRLTDQEPTAYALTVGAVGTAPFGGRWTASYTRVSFLAYRTPNPAEAVMRRRVGLARNFSDYEEATLEGEWLLLPRVLVRPQVALLRQGEGDFRQPYPDPVDFPTTPSIFAGVVERTVRAALAGDAVLGRRLSATFDVGVHRVDEARHVSGASETEIVAGLRVLYHFGGAASLP